MHLLIALIGIVAAAAFWMYRIRQTSEMANDLLDAANDVRLAARRFGYKRRSNVHPADSVEDARVAAAGVVLAMAGMDRAVGPADLQAMSLQAQSRFNVSKSEATEIVTLGRWLGDQCANRDEAVRRLTKRVRDLAGHTAWPDLQAMIEAVAGRGQPLSEEVRLSLAGVERHLTGR